MNVISESIKKATAIFVLFLLTCMSLNQAFNGHSHQLADGTKIYHAHPFNKDASGSPGHEHTQQEYTFYQHVTDLLWLILISTGLTFIFFCYTSGTIPNIYFFYHEISILSKQNKSPPSLNHVF